MLRHDELLSRHTSFKIGGPGFCWLEPENLQDILEIISLAEDKNKPLAIFGKGTNLLVRDNGFDGIIIHLNEKFFGNIEKEDDEVIKAGAGLSVSKLVKYAYQNSLAGCEFLSGIPGNFGGAVFMNGGVRSLEDSCIFNEIKDIIFDIETLDLRSKRLETLRRQDINFKYRSSGLEHKLILGGRILLKKGEKEHIKNKADSFLKKREWICKIGFPSAGSVFKNPEYAKPAGFLIESCGLKGKRIGRAEISKVHGNFIVNLGGALAKDVLDLIELARTNVKEKFGIDLETELRII